MGDGRYYTYYQFFDVFLVLISIILAIGNLIYFQYRKSKDTKLAHINIPLILIIVFCIIGMIETVIPNLYYAYMLRNIECGLLLLVIIMFSLDKETINSNKKIIVGLLISIILILFFNGIFVKSYDFHKVVYTYLYRMLLVSCLIIWVFLSVKNLFIKKISYNNKQIISIKLFTVLIPILIYLVILTKNSNFLEYFEMIMIICFTIYIYLSIKLNNESSLTMLAFDKIREVSTNYIFVTDETYKLIYKNKAATKSGFFNEALNINASDFSTMFKGNSVKRTTDLGKEYIRLEINDDTKYFAYKKKPLESGQKNIGFIITITNITDLIKLLVNLENKKEESIIANEKLKKYSDVVYHVEKEKRINILLEEILSLRDIQMQRLSQMIFDTKEKSNEKNFEGSVDVAINLANEILEEVRDTVSKYREYDSIKTS